MGDEPISRGPRSTAKAIARSTHGFGSWTGSASPARGLRVMRAHGLLSPHRGRQGAARPTTGGSHPGAQRTNARDLHEAAVLAKFAADKPNVNADVWITVSVQTQPVEEPETNGVAERWNRRSQAIHGRIFQNLAAVRAAVADFVERYNQTWRLEKLGYQTPIEAREEYELRQAA